MFPSVVVVVLVMFPSVLLYHSNVFTVFHVCLLDPITSKTSHLHPLSSILCLFLFIPPSLPLHPTVSGCFVKTN